MTEISKKLDYLEAIAGWFVNIGETHRVKGRLEDSLRYTYLAANILSSQNRILTSERLELNLRLIGELIRGQWPSTSA